MLDTEGFPCHYKFVDDEQATWSSPERAGPSVSVDVRVHQAVTQIFTPCFTQPGLVPAGSMSSQHLSVSVTRHRQKMTWDVASPGTWDKNVKEEFISASTSEKLGNKRKCLRNWLWEVARKWAVLSRCWSSSLMCEQHRLSQLCQQHPPAMGLPCTIRISPGKPELFGNLCPRDLLPVSALVEFCPCTAFLPVKTWALGFLPAFPFFKSLFF